MGRLCLAAALMLATLAPAPRARAAEVTRVATAAEKDNPFDLVLSVRWDRIQEKALITRERAVDAATLPPWGGLEDITQLRYFRQANVIVPRIAFGVYEDVEVHVEMPYVLNDDRSWRYGLVNGVPADVAYPGQSIGDNTVDAMNRTCPGAVPCPLFSVPGTVYHGGQLGDVKVGAAWAILNDAKDPTTSSWVVGVDVTGPSAKLYDPALNRGITNWDSPYAVPAKPGPLGEQVWRYDAWTALSRRFGPADPYIRVHATSVRKSNKTYSNCDHADEMSALAVAQYTIAGAENCKASSWEKDSGAQLPWMGGMTLGVELVPFEKPGASQKVSLDFRGTVEYTSSQRFYNQLTDPTGKLLFTEPFYTLGGKFTLLLRASKYFTFDATATYQKQTDHALTGESLGRSGVDAAGNDITGGTSNAQMNPNYDWRWDAPGRRFRLKESNIFTAAVGAQLTF